MFSNIDGAKHNGAKHQCWLVIANNLSILGRALIFVIVRYYNIYFQTILGS